jgi:hypothetical protein
MNALKLPYLLYPVIAFTFLLLANYNAFSQTYQLNIRVYGDSSLPIPHASLRLQQQKLTTDSSGQLQLNLPAGEYNISASAVGFNNASLQFRLSNDTSIFLSLPLRQSMLGNVTVSSSRHVAQNQMSVQSIDIEQLKRLPVILGEIDPLKTITLLPGIKNGGEASAGIYVRGGGPDQNLVLLDGIPVYNPNHLLGFFSIFNGEAIKNIEVIKGGIPAEYGGRLSSVITIDTRNGNKDSIKGSGGIGLISSRASVEGPLIKGRSSFIFSARRTYIDQVGRLVAKSKIGDNGYYFYDINAKADYIIDKNNSIDLTFYTGTDDFSFVDNDDNDGRDRLFNANWGNTLAGISWKQQINKRMKQEFSAVYNQFNLDSRITYGTTTFAFSSGLKDYQLKNDWTYTVRNWMKWKWGVQYTWHSFQPGAGGVTAGVQDFKSKLNDQYAREAAAYFSTDIRVSPKLSMIAGLRYSYFNQVGPTERVLYDADGAPTGEVERFEKGESIAKYHYPEPRFSALYRLNSHSSIKASYTRTTQFLHLATTSAATFPSELWVPSSKLIQPGIAQQVAAGYFREIKNGEYEFSVETYYKTLSNQLEFKPGAQLLLNQNLEGEMIFGTGKAYGIELFLQKKKGQLTGWIGYTFSRTERTFPELNEGRAFPYRYDRTHDLSVVGNYRLSKKWEASAVFVYGTGNALTMPTGRFTYNLGYDANNQAPIFTNINQYGGINDYRMPAYHRMDIAFTYTPKPESTKRFKSSWNFSIYNLYNRYNPYFIYLDTDDGERTIQGKKVFLFPIMPGVTWNFKF